MSQKDAVERLRGIIRALEARKDLRLPIESENGPIRTREEVCSSPPQKTVSTLAHSDSLYVSKFNRVREQEGFKVFETGYGLSEVLSPCSKEHLPALRSFAPEIEGPESWVFMDLETTGLLGAGTFPFLFGLGRWLEDQFIVSQYFIEDRSYEEEVLEKVLLDMGNGAPRVLVTFNGKSFDVPLFNGRLIMSGMDRSLAAKAHLDLMHMARNLMAGLDSGFSLEKCARRFLGTTRENDVPGRMIPALYFIYERDGDESVLYPVFKHNRLDILDMASLSSLWAKILFGNMDSLPSGIVPFVALSCGKAHYRRKNTNLAEKCLLSAEEGIPSSEEARRLLASCFRKNGHWEEAFPIWEDLCSKGTKDFRDYLWLARYYEVVCKDIGRALDMIEKCQKALLDQGQKPPPPLDARKRRLSRLLV